MPKKNDDLVKKFLQFGVGAIFISKETIEKLARDIKKKYDLDRETSKKAAREIIKKSTNLQKKFQKNLVSNVEKVLNDYGIIKKKARKGKNVRSSKKKTKKK